MPAPAPSPVQPAPTPAPVPTSPMASTTPGAASSIGPVIGAAVIVLLLAAGGAYFYYMMMQEPTAADFDWGADTTGQQMAPGAADDVDTLEAELNATQTGGVDEDLTNLESAL